MGNTYLLFIPILPLIGFLINGLIGHKLNRKVVGTIGGATVLGSFILSLMTLFRILGDGNAVSYVAFHWITIADLDITFGFRIDQLSAVMINVITGVGFLIHVYSNGYMHEDKSVARFFAYLNLFVFSMLILVMADNIVLMFLGWEGVGLCSYLLIGFWYQDMFTKKLSNADAGKKAFIVNRVGDFGFLLAIFLIFMTFGTLNFEQLSHADMNIAGGLITAITLLLFLGATGKSAQIPLYIWLPDAMAGPTPVSALIHAATMVTAGIYMIGRLSFMFVHSETTMLTIAVIGTLTAVFSATMGLTQNDIKKVLAYSTVSQLGYMFMAMGVGAFSAGIFHLMTHAFFKALLFLGAGSVILACHHEQDMRKMGALKDKIPTTFWMFAIGSLALMGIPPFAGFFSKDDILARVFVEHKALWALGLVGAGMTAFYTARMVAMTFFGTSKMTKKQELHVHEPGISVRFVLIALGVLSAIGGLIGIPAALHGGAHFSHFLDPVFEAAQAHQGGHHHLSHLTEWILMVISIAVVATGGWLGFDIYSKEKSIRKNFVKHPIGGKLHHISYNKYYIDEIYDFVIVKSIMGGSKALWKFFDVTIIDGFVNFVADIVAFISGIMRKIQTGHTNSYAFSIFIGALGILIYIASRL
ncbi:MAG: NADH-quinone oxidoreductase subunit L [Candidatus Cloacimonetes bacterium 4572_55]|nr:MAG: NADH-quinone oxidoreductase subunit L [Candidatus Cloacimonetes bacterium 4572_55]